MSKALEHRIFGPPGTGKTTYLAKQIERAAQVRGAKNVLVASFTRAAAAELLGRKLPVSENRLGTLHSIAYHALGRPEIVQVPKYIKDWNEEHPHWSLSNRHDTLDEMSGEFEGGTESDQLFNEYMRWRALRSGGYPARIESLHKAWANFKQETNTVDFTDLIEQALEKLPSAPGNPQIGFFDEVQDFSKLELDLVRQWAQGMEQIQVAGDDDQSIYYFKGATPDAFLKPEVPEEQNRVLGQSYRLPRTIQAYADQWIQKVSYRHPKSYQPRDCEGEILHSTASYQDSGALLKELLPDCSGNVMILASCAYMLIPILQKCRSNGIPFHNPYRRSAGQWNPLLKRKRLISSLDRLHAFVVPDIEQRFWRAREVKLWTDCIEASTMYYRAKSSIDELYSNNDEFLTPEDIRKFFFPDHLERILARDLNWFEDHLLSGKTSGMSLPLAIARRWGAKALLKPPRVTIGTIHSVKGGEADTVILFPDLSTRASEAWSRGLEGQDAIRRTFYVGITRAKERLILCRSVGRSAINWR